MLSFNVLLYILNTCSIDTNAKTVIITAPSMCCKQNTDFCGVRVAPRPASCTLYPGATPDLNQTTVSPVHVRMHPAGNRLIHRSIPVKQETTQPPHCLPVMPSRRERLGSWPCERCVSTLHSERRSQRQEDISPCSRCVRRAPAGCRAGTAWWACFHSGSPILSCRVRFLSIRSWFWTESWKPGWCTLVSM